MFLGTIKKESFWGEELFFWEESWDLGATADFVQDLLVVQISTVTPEGAGGHM